jgi:predicted phage terminase large subunit-like protein
MSYSQQADSKVYLQSLYNFWDEVIKTRMRNNTAVILMHTRWRDDDLIGYLKKNYPDENWFEFSLKAIDEETNTALCEEIVNIDELRKRQSNNPRSFAALYQQSPMVQGGNLIKDSWWKFYRLANKPEKFDVIIQSWDLNAEKGENNDMTVGQTWGMVKGKNPADHRVYLLYQVREQADFIIQLKMFSELTKKEPRAYKKLVEKKSNGIPLITILSKKIRGIEPIVPLGSKETRASSIIPYLQAGQIFIPDPKETPWATEFINEHSLFPNGDYDDQVDSTSQALYHLLGPYDETQTADEIIRMFS